MIRQQLGGTAEYAAQIGKLQIALRGVAGSQSNYTQALSAAEAATRELNIPQMEATQGITRLSAAVLGAGGTMGDATFAFRAISESIKATGGNAEQVDGALLALTQVFSKGKVSAEELNQIAERLPGTFTLFAQAAGKSGPELQKALEQGEVGLNDLMKFLEMASSKYGSTAMRIAKSSEESGARLQIAYDKMRLDIGKALAPIGAELQSAFADFITNLAPSVVDSNGNIGASFAILIDPVRRIIDLFKELGQTKSDLQPLFDYIGYNIKALTTFFYANNLILEATIKRVVTSAATIAALVKGDFAAVQRLTVQAAKSEQAAFNSIPQTLGNIWNPAPKLADIRGTGRQVQGPGATGSNFPNPVADGKDKKTKEEKEAEQLAETERRLAQEGIKLQMDGQLKAFEYAVELDRRRYELQKQLQDEATANEIEALQGGARTVAQAFANYRARIAEIDRSLLTAQENVDIARERYRTSQVVSTVVSGRNYANVGGTGAGGRQMLHGIPGYAGYDASHATPDNIHYHFAGKDPAETLAVATYLKGLGYKISEFKPWNRVGGHAEGSQHYSGNAFDIGGATMGQTMAEIREGQKKVHQLINDFLSGTTRSVAAAAVAGQTATTGRERSNLLRGQKVGAKVDSAALEVSQATDLMTLEKNKVSGRKLEAEKALTLELTKAYSSARYELQLTYDLDLKRAELQRSGASTAEIDKELKLYELRRRNAEEIKRIELEISDPGERQKQLDAVNQGLRDQVDLMQKIYDLNEATANSVGFREGAQRYVESIGTLREATAGLAQQGFKGIEDSIVSLATTGTANFAQFATSLLNDMARIIIQQLVVKQLTQAIMGLFGGGGGGGLGNYGVNLGMGFNQIPSFPMGSALPSFAGFAGMAKGGVLGANGIVPYAKGGVVTRPMLFPFANGGAIGTGLMGEAGPEAIMPLSRGANGKLGVLAAGGGTTNVVVNVDASGNSSVQGRDDRAGQLGRVISQAVQAELIKQRRPGGILA
jgi:lambda family phage tail tape measure protein